MTHLPFIAASYALGVLVPVAFGVSAFLRMNAARRRLAAIDPRVDSSAAGHNVNRPDDPRVDHPEGPRRRRARAT